MTTENSSSTQAAQEPKTGLSTTAKSVITIGLLIVLFPVGLIMMFVWKLWPVWVRVVVTIAVLGIQALFWLIIIPVIVFGLLAGRVADNINAEIEESSSLQDGVSYSVIDSYALAYTDFAGDVETSCIVELQVENTTSEEVDFTFTTFELFEEETGASLTRDYYIGEAEESIEIPSLTSINSARANKTVKGYIPFSCNTSNTYDLEISEFSFFDADDKITFNVSFDTVKQVPANGNEL